MSFVHLHVYSSYSLLSSTASIADLVQDAKQKGFSAIALTDQNVMYGTIAFYKECLKASIKPIIGLTVMVQSERKDQSYPLVLLAKNQKGFHHLLKISSVVQTNSPSGIPMKWLRGYAEGIIAISPGMKGEIEQSLLSGDYEEAFACARMYKNIFPNGHFYLGIQDHGLVMEETLHNGIVKLSKDLQLALVATNEVYYTNKEDSFAHECLLAIKNGQKLADETREKLDNDQYYLKTATEMVNVFSHIPEALENSLRIADACNVMIELNQMNLPKYPSNGVKSSEELLEELCYKGFQERYQNGTDEHRTRLEYELSIIKNMKFADYFLIVWDFMRFSRENGILTGPGRGSAAGSMVAYVLYITDVDPIEHQLLFERFLNPERISMPDIDIDFPDHRRDEVIEYVSEKYGRIHVAQIITFGTLAAKAVMRDVGKIFGLNGKELDQVSRWIPSRPGTSLSTALKESQGLRNFVKESTLHQRLFEVATKLEGLPRHTSTHAAGVVLTERPLVESIPIQAGHNEIYLTQYTMDHLEEIGLLKMDFLGLRNLSLIETVLDSIFRKTGKRINIKEIPLEDEATFKLLSRGETTGVFQLESDGMRNVLKRLQPSRFEDIVAVNALYRPGPMENIPLYIDRKHGKASVTYPHPDLIPILERTYGVIVYQEQIMQIAAKMAGFSLGEADLLRRAVSKKKKEVLNKERDHFVQGSLAKGYDKATANDIYDLIVKFANYGFNRSHAVAYSVIAYQLAYLKTHYPVHFMAALLSSVSNSETKIAQYIREIKQMEIQLLPPSINQSGYSFLVDQNGIRYSLAAIKGVGIAALKEIFHARKKRKFADLFDFCIRVSSRVVNRKVLEALVHSGSFDEFGEDRAVLLASIDVAIEHAQLINPNEDGEGDLFAEEETFFLKPKYVEVDEIEVEQKLHFEKEVLGFYLSDHPVSIYNAFMSPLGISEIAFAEPNQKMIKAMINITEFKRIRTKKGEEMAFLAISDQSGDMDAVVFPAVYKRFAHVLQKGNIVLVEGKMDLRDGNKQFIIQAVYDVRKAVEEIKDKLGTLYLKVEKEKESALILTRLKEMMKKNKGTVEVVLFYESKEQSIRLGKDDRVNPSETCLNELKLLLGENNVILKKE